MDKDRITGSAEDFAGKVGNTVGGMTGDAKAQAEGLARQTAGKAQNLYGQTKDMAREATDTATNYARQAYENSGDAVRDGSQAIAERVKENPLGSVMIAGAIGFGLALMLMRPPSRPSRRWRYYG
jgi:uncharacterized protein YjbJ (UPF0337 family)